MDFDTKKDELLFTARVNIKIHQNLEMFYSAFIRWTSVFSILASSAAFAALTTTVQHWTNIEKDSLIAFFSICISISNAIQLGFNFSSKLQIHSSFRKKWTDIEYRIKSIRESSNESLQSLVDLEKIFYQLHSEEPPVSEFRKRQAFNYAVESLGYDESNKIKLFRIKLS